MSSHITLRLVNGCCEQRISEIRKQIGYEWTGKARVTARVGDIGGVFMSNIEFKLSASITPVAFASCYYVVLICVPSPQAKSISTQHSALSIVLDDSLAAAPTRLCRYEAQSRHHVSHLAAASGLHETLRQGKKASDFHQLYTQRALSTMSGLT